MAPAITSPTSKRARSPSGGAFIRPGVVEDPEGMGVCSIEVRPRRSSDSRARRGIHDGVLGKSRWILDDRVSVVNIPAGGVATPAAGTSRSSKPEGGAEKHLEGGAVRLV